MGDKEFLQIYHQKLCKPETMEQNSLSAKGGKFFSQNSIFSEITLKKRKRSEDVFQ